MDRDCNKAEKPEDTARETSLDAWAPEDKPREKILKNGVASVSDQELLAVMLGSGVKGKNVMDMANDILDYFDGNLRQLKNFSAQEFMQNFKGIGEAQALKLVASLEFGRRRSEHRTPPRRIISSESIRDFFFNTLLDKNYEEFHVLYLSRSHNVLKNLCVGTGSSTAVVVDIKQVLRHAIAFDASSMVICHNHPSGNPLPSEYDKDVTKKVGEAARLFNITLLDHVIVTSDAGNYYSFSDNCAMC